MAKDKEKPKEYPPRKSIDPTSFVSPPKPDKPKTLPSKGKQGDKPSSNKRG